MPLLGGLFHKRNQTSRRPSNPTSTATESVASSASNRDSADGDYVLPDKSLPPPPPIYNLPAAGSSSKLKLPFRRKAVPPQPDPKDTSLSVVSLNDVPSPPYLSSVTSDPGHGLLPPPRKSSIFAAYNDSRQSVHSLPNDSSVHPDTLGRLSSSDIRSEAHSSPAGQAHKKSAGLFSWARERTKSKPSQPSSTVSSPPPTSPPADDPSSFYLMSFRHVRADSPATPMEKSPQSLSSVSSSQLAPPHPRPRGDSVASDSSQRISVAAFREAQARSRANSPAPSFRPPSTADTLRVDATGRKRASTVSVVSGSDLLQPNKSTAPMSSRRPDSSALDTSSESSESESEDEEVDSDGEPVPKPTRKRTITRRVARSDAGHSAVANMSHNRQDPPKPSASPLTYQSDQASSTRPRASASTSALTPSAAARRASILAATNSSSSSQAQSKRPPPKPKDDSDESTDSSDTDSEDMPLSDLVAPRRPGSSASNRSNSRPRMPAKPLIDINSLVGGPPLLKPILRHEDSVRNLRKEEDVEKDLPFSIPAVLALSSSTSPPVTPSTSKPNTTPVDKPASTAHHRRSSSDVPASAKTKEPDNDDDLMNAIRLVGALDKELDQPSGPPMLSVNSTSDRIVPTPIRAREPTSSFTVLSRPPHRQSTAETSSSLSPASQTQFNVTSPALSPQHEIVSRQRAPTVVNPPAQKDKSDTMSVSAKSTTSRTSSRIPPVPLIHSIPDSPSVKEEYKPGRPRSASRPSATNASESRSHPPTLVSAMSSTSNKKLSHGYQPSLMPQRPFASSRSIRGESPAGSSTGDSSSGRAPFTPRDGSDIGVRSKDDASDVGSTLKARGHAKKPSVTFEDEVRGRDRAKTDLTGEQRTRERRRSEAKAAIELGKIVNGRGPLVPDADESDDMGLRGRNPAISVTTENGMPGMMQPGWPAWQQPMPMVPPQFGNDPAYLAAHQRALLIAKQTYQMAVAQHAMQMAGEEWERSSNIGFGSGSSAYGGGSVYGGGSGGSVYGGGSGGSVYGGMGGGMVPMGMMGMNMGMLMPPNQWGRSSVAFPSSASAYGGISSSQSEFGGVSGWGARSAHGDSRSSHGAPNSAASAYGGSRPRAWTGAAPPSSSSAQPTRTPGKTPARTRAAPPSSWKSGR